MSFEKPEDRVPAMQRALRGIAPERPPRHKLAIETRPKKVISLVRVLYRCYVLNAALLLFDDPGRVAYDEDACDILKISGFGMQRMVVFEPPEITRNELYRQSGHRGFNPFTPPPEFPLPANLRWLWLANTNYADPAILEKLGDHFAPLIARGLNPDRVGDDREHDNYALFLYVHHKATEENLLRSMGFPYQVSRQAVNFYLTHANTLIDLCPRRLELIARAFDPKVPKEVRDSEFGKHGSDNGRRPSSQAQAARRMVAGYPAGCYSGRRHRSRSQRRHRQKNPQPEPDPDPPPAARQTPVSEPDPEPDPPAPASVIDPPPPDTSLETAQAAPAEPNLSPELTFGQAIRAVYALGDRRTCDRVTDILDRCPLEECADDELTEVAQALDGCSEWHAEHVQSICHTFAQYADGILLFCTDDEVLVWEGSENGLQIYRWDAVRQMMAPHVAEEKRRWEAQQREQDTKVLLTRKLPAKRKLKAVKERIDRIVELKAARFTEKAQRAIDHIRQMTDDDPRFSECTKLEQYIDAVAGCLSSGSGSD